MENNGAVTSRIIDLFYPRTDVHPFQWWSEQRGVGGYSKACALRPPWAKNRCSLRVDGRTCATCDGFEAIPVDEDVIARHLAGEITIGSYQLANDGHTVRWACLDFDDNGHTTPEELQTAALTTYTSLQELGMPVSMEASGGKGWRCHLWVFFSELVEARKARIILDAALRQANLAGYPFVERFPKQDTAPNGYGNLVKIPFGVHRKTGNRSSFLDPMTLNPIMSIPEALGSIQTVDAAAVDFAIDMRGLTIPEDFGRVSAPAKDFDHNPEPMQRAMRTCWYWRALQKYQESPRHFVHYEDWWNLVCFAARFGKAGTDFIERFSQQDDRYDADFTTRTIEYIRANGYHAPSCRRLRQGPGLVHCPKEPSQCGAPNAEGKRLFDGPEWQGRDVTRHPQRVVVNL